MHIVQHVDLLAASISHRGNRQRLRPSGGIHVPAHRDHRSQFLKRFENGGVAHVACMKMISTPRSARSADSRSSP